MLKFHGFTIWLPFVFLQSNFQKTNQILSIYSNIYIHVTFHENLSSGSGDRAHTMQRAELAGLFFCMFLPFFRVPSFSSIYEKDIETSFFIVAGLAPCDF